jgi:hypothetical protein
VQPTAEPSVPQPSRLGLGLALGWLVVTVLGCLANLALVFTPEIAINVSLVSVPLVVSGWGAVAGAAITRRRGATAALVGPLVGAGVGLVLGVITIGGVYSLFWPGFF